MFSFGKLIWRKIVNAGVTESLSVRQRNSIVAVNKAWSILMAIQLSCLVSHIINQLGRSAAMTAFYIAGLVMVHILMRAQKVNAAKITAIAVINANTFLMAIFLGAHTRIIDFLLLTALLPLYLFEIDNRKMIIWGMLISIVPFAAYQYTAPLLEQFALPITEQLQVYQTTTWVIILCLAALLYLIYDKNLSYERDVNATEKRLIEQRKLYEMILEQIPIDIVTFDKELRYTYINSTAVKDPEVRKWLIGKTNVEYFKNRNLDLEVAYERDKILHEALKKGGKVETEEIMTDRHGNKRHSIKGSSPVYSDGNKDLLCLIGYSLDITEIKQAEQKLRNYAIELERKNEDLQHFVNATSHDLRSPLRNIVSYLQLLERKNKQILDEDSRSMISFTIKSVKHLNQLISDIYQYSIADSNDKPSEAADLNRIVNNVVEQLSASVSEKNAYIHIGELPQLQLVPSHMETLFSNLIGNGLKYNTAAQPLVTVACTEAEEYYTFSISDNGIGIAVEYHKKIFEMFRRLHTSEEYEGTGMGLAICKKIVESYGGKIWVETPIEGGARFCFTLAKKIVGGNNATDFSIANYNFAMTG
ncbi:MAG: ATP-binding protein [Chitinophagales bacterium]